MKWFNEICQYPLYGYHVYPQEPFETIEGYIRKKKTPTGKTHAFPRALIADKKGIIRDTLYRYQEAVLNNLVKQKFTHWRRSTSYPCEVKGRALEIRLAAGWPGSKATLGRRNQVRTYRATYLKSKPKMYRLFLQQSQSIPQAKE